MSATSFIQFQPPCDLSNYDRSLPLDQQSTSIPKTFLDAMQVRMAVFVEEQGVPLENEYDSDDARACHWVIYSSMNETTDAEVKKGDGNVLQREKSQITSQPVGTIRLVPFPHSPHPEPGSRYATDALETNPRPSTDQLPYIIDRPTTYHDGVEPYIKLGRLAVLKEYRGSGFAKTLVDAAKLWAQINPRNFNPSTKQAEIKNAGVKDTKDITHWKGLICVHAQEQVSGAWAKWGFKVDEEMRTWYEEGIKHVGMFNRVDIKPLAPDNI